MTIIHTYSSYYTLHICIKRKLDVKQLEEPLFLNDLLRINDLFREDKEKRNKKY